MDKEKLISEILEIEWEMFHNVNGEERASCQNNNAQFIGLRTAQYSVWSEATLRSYLEDIKRAKNEGRNIAREKYIYMMASTAPAEYAVLKSELLPASDEKKELIEKIWAIELEQTIKMRKEFPKITSGGRKLRISEEEFGYPSVENYQKSELMTYSDETVRLLLADVEAARERGEEFFRTVQENSVKCMGFSSMKEAEEAL